MPTKRSNRAPELEGIHAQIRRRHAGFETGAANNEDLAQEAIASLLARNPSEPAAYAHQVASNAAKPRRRKRSILAFTEDRHLSAEEELMGKERHVLMMVAMEQFIAWNNMDSTGVFIDDLHAFDDTQVLLELRFYQTIIEKLPYSPRHVRRLTMELRAALQTALEKSSYGFTSASPFRHENVRGPHSSTAPTDKDEAEISWHFEFEENEEAGELVSAEPEDEAAQERTQNPLDEPGFDKWFMCSRGTTLLARLGASLGDEAVRELVEASYLATYGADAGDSASNNEESKHES